MKFAAYVAFLFITFFHILLFPLSIILHTDVFFVCFCVNFNLRIFIVMFMYCYVSSVLCTLFHCVVLCVAYV